MNKYKEDMNKKERKEGNEKRWRDAKKTEEVER